MASPLYAPTTPRRLGASLRSPPWRLGFSLTHGEKDLELNFRIRTPGCVARLSDALALIGDRGFRAANQIQIAVETLVLLPY